LFPEQASAGFAVFARYCSSCHAMPDLSSHSAAEWEWVVRRMRTHRVQQGLGTIPEDDEILLLDYLKTHAGKDE